jgi:hypothetical protein
VALEQTAQLLRLPLQLVHVEAVLLYIAVGQTQEALSDKLKGRAQAEQATELEQFRQLLIHCKQALPFQK